MVCFKILVFNFYSYDFNNDANWLYTETEIVIPIRIALYIKKINAC